MYSELFCSFSPSLGMMSNQHVVVLGASEKPSRYSFIAASKLHYAGHEVTAIGRKEGVINSISILLGQPNVDSVDTLTLYINPKIQKSMEDYILNMKPKRVIFNPGTENTDLFNKLSSQGAQCMNACTIVMLNTGLF